MRSAASNSRPSTACDALAEQDVLGAQVAVAVAYAAGEFALGQFRPEGGERGAAEAGERGEPARRRARGGERRQRLLDHGGEARRHCFTGAAAWKPATAAPTANASDAASSPRARCAASVADSS